MAIFSAYCFEPSSRSTARSYAPLDESFRKSFSSLTVGGRPVKSSETRRSKVERSALGDGFRCSVDNRFPTKRSMALLAPSASVICAIEGLVGAVKAQCFE